MKARDSPSSLAHLSGITRDELSSSRKFAGNALAVPGMIITTRLFEVTSGQMAPRDVGASRSSQCDWRDSRSSPLRSRAAIPLPAGSLSPSSALSLSRASLVYPSRALRTLSVSPLPLVPVESASIHHSVPRLFPACVFLCLTLSASCALLAPSSTPSRFLRLALSPSFTTLLPSFLSRSNYPRLFLSHVSTLRVLSRLLLSLGNPPDTGQAGGHVNTGSANRAPTDVIRVGSRTVRERSRGRKGAFADSRGEMCSDVVGMDGRPVRSTDDV